MHENCDEKTIYTTVQPPITANAKRPKVLQEKILQSIVREPHQYTNGWYSMKTPYSQHKWRRKTRRSLKILVCVWVWLRYRHCTCAVHSAATVFISFERCILLLYRNRICDPHFQVHFNDHSTNCECVCWCCAHRMKETRKKISLLPSHFSFRCTGLILRGLLPLECRHRWMNLVWSAHFFQPCFSFRFVWLGHLHIRWRCHFQCVLLIDVDSFDNLLINSAIYLIAKRKNVIEVEFESILEYLFTQHLSLEFISLERNILLVT